MVEAPVQEGREHDAAEPVERARLDSVEVQSAVEEELIHGLFEPHHPDEDAEDDTDYVFDVPIDVASAITGFRHDSMELGEDQSVFTALEEV